MTQISPFSAAYSRFCLWQLSKSRYLEEMNPESTKPSDFTDESLDTADELAETAEHEKEYRRLNDDAGLEKGDLPALIISALIVFSPIFLVLIGIMVLAWIFLS